jgi:hypothetical protein
MLFLCQKVVHIEFLKIFILLDFVTKLILKSQRNLPENINKEAIQKTAIPMKNSSKILDRRNVKKLVFFWLTVLLEGGDEIRSLSLGFCDKIKHPQTVTFLWQIENIFRFFVTFQCFHALF